MPPSPAPRALHEQDVCEFTDDSLQTILDRHRHGKTLVVAADDDSLAPLLPVSDQQRLVDTLSFGPDATLHVAPINYPDRDPDAPLPLHNDERFHFDANAYETVILLMSRCGQFQRSQPFLDLTRVTKPDGTLISAVGLDATADSHRDAKWWVPSSSDATLDRIVVRNYENFQTPQITSIFTVTEDHIRWPDATITTDPANTTRL